LLSAIPVPDPAASTRLPTALSGELPSPMAPPSGCRFRTRCPRAEERCAVEEPMMRPVTGGSGHFVACHFPLIEAAESPSTVPVSVGESADDVGPLGGLAGLGGLGGTTT
jgi:oligopeptide/dipeptide ABC transporter ATP-binding protein